MGNEPSANDGKFPAKPFHSIQSNAVLKPANVQQNNMVNLIGTNMEQSITSPAISPTTSSNVEQPYASPNMEQPSALQFDIPTATTKKLTKKQENAQIWKADFDKAVHATPDKNITTHIRNFFDYKRRLAKGSSCRVLLCQHKSTKTLCALKEMDKYAQWNPILYLTEVNILQTLKHKNIMTYFDSYIDKSCLYIASEYCGGGTLLDRIINMKTFTEKIAAKYITTILKVVGFIHKHNIAHRDLKPNNVVFQQPGPDGVLKLIDFGDAIIIEDNEEDRTFVGTLHYFTPEMIRNPRRKGWEIRKADTYCVGVIAYVLLTGCFPFHAQDQRECKKEILNGTVQWPKHVELSDECQHFILSLLNQNVKQRLSATQALDHKWLTGYASENDLGKRLKKYQKDFHHSNLLQCLLIDAMFAEMTNTDKKFCISELRKYKSKRGKHKSNEKSRRSSLVYEQEFIEFMIANHVNPSTAKLETHTLFKQISLRQRNSKEKTKEHNEIPSLEAIDVNVVLEELVSDELGFEYLESPGECVLNIDEKWMAQTSIDEDILAALDPHKKQSNKTQMNALPTIRPKAPSANSLQIIDRVNNGNKMKAKQQMKFRSQSMKRDYQPSIKIIHTDLKLLIEISHSSTSNASDVLTCDLDSSDFKEAVEFGRQKTIYKTSIDLNKNVSITVEQFRGLLSKAPKGFDIESVINDLDPNHSGTIDLRNITNYARDIEMDD